MPFAERVGLQPVVVFAVLALGACGGAKPEVAPSPVVVATPAPPPPVVITDTVTVKDTALEARTSRLELQVLEKDAQIEELQNRLDDARREVVRTMARLQTFATRAEAASGMAEAEVSAQSLKAAAGRQSVPELAQVSDLLRQSTEEFNKEDYGGALYLATTAKATAERGRARLSGLDRGSLRPGEVVFAGPIRLQVVSRCNVREGPGTGYKILFTLETGTLVTGASAVDTWMRVSDENRRSGWVSRALVGKRK